MASWEAMRRRLHRAPARQWHSQNGNDMARTGVKPPTSAVSSHHYLSRWSAEMVFSGEKDFSLEQSDHVGTISLQTDQQGLCQAHPSTASGKSWPALLLMQSHHTQTYGSNATLLRTRVYHVVNFFISSGISAPLCSI